jgi:gliding motility-associated-like protein
MTRNKLSPLFLILILILKASIGFAQAPAISYQTPQTYYINSQIAPLAPINIGGVVPLTGYGNVSILAGNGAPGYTDGTASMANLNGPYGITIDGSGNIYFTDDPSMVRKVTAAGVVTTIAGGNQVHDANGQGNAAGFGAAAGITTDAAGNIYVADQLNNLIRKITPGGLVTTLAGSDAPNAIFSGSLDGNLTTARFVGPIGLVFDSKGNLFVSEFDGDVIRKIDKNGQVSTFAGLAETPGLMDGAGPAARFNNPTFLTIDASDNIYVADNNNDAIRKITPSGIVTTVQIKNANSFSIQTGIATDAVGNIYYTDPVNDYIRKVAPDGTIVAIAGNGIRGFPIGQGPNVSFRDTYGVVYDGKGNLYVTDALNYIICKVSLLGYSIDKTLPPGLSFDFATGIITGTPTAASPATDYTITACNADGSSSTVVNIKVNNVATVPVPPPNISYQSPQTYTITTAIPALAPTNTGGAVPANAYGQVTTVAGTGSTGSADGAAKSATFGLPVGITSDNTGNLYVTEFSNNDVRKISPAGVVSTLAGGSLGAANGQGAAAGFEGPYGLTPDAAGNLYIADKTNQEIREVTPAGVVTTFAGNGTQASVDGPVASAEFTNPLAVVFDAQGNMYIADSGNSRIRKIDPSGQVTTFAVLDPSADPDNNSDTAFGYLAIDAAGNLYIPYNNQVMKITPAGNITAIAGSGYPGFKNGAGTSASFDNLVGIAVDPLGNVYVADEGNNAIRKITPAGVVSTLAGGTQGSADGIGGAANFYGPYGITMDNTGGYLYVTDTHNNLIRKVTLTGYTIDKPLPAGLSFDPKTGIITGTPTVVSPAATYTVTAYNLGGSSTTTVTISVVSEQTVAFPPLLSKTVCAADFDAGATGAGPITYTSDNTAVATIVGGKVHIVGAGQATITATDGISQAAQLLVVTAAENASVTISTSAPDYCQGDTVTFSATANNAGANPLYQWQINGINVGANTANPVFTTNNLISGDKIICILTNNLACAVNPTDTSNTVVIFFDTPVTAAVQIISSADGPICAGTPVTFTANAITSDTSPSYQWLVNGKDAGTNNPVFTANNLTEGDSVTCILISNGNCQVNTNATSNAIYITLNAASLCTIVIPNTITPNGDGINDVWNITSLQRYPQCLVNIYTRYGTKVYSSVGYPKAWDGTYKNGALPVGTYYYVIDLKNGEKPLSGFITIVR